MHVQCDEQEVSMIAFQSHPIVRGKLIMLVFYDLPKLFFVMVFADPTILQMIKDHSFQKNVGKVIKLLPGTSLQVLILNAKISDWNLRLLVKRKRNNVCDMGSCGCVWKGV